MVMASAGNDMVNSIWEVNIDGHQKPSPSSTRYNYTFIMLTLVSFSRDSSFSAVKSTGL